VTIRYNKFHSQLFFIFHGMPTHSFIFDFDGTLADTANTNLMIIRQFHKEYDLKYVHNDDIEFYRGLTAQEIFKQLKIPKFRIPFILRRARRELSKHIHQQQPFAGWHETLASLKSQGDRLFILSSNSASNILTFLNNHQMRDYFDAIDSGTSLFGKARSLKKMIKTQRINPQTAYYIADETRDIEAAKKVGIPMISVTWGYNNKTILKKMNPEYLIESPNELLSLICRPSNF
jgi:phosphoglycolate phosphatase-like HAD superfamily hydrolase